MSLFEYTQLKPTGREVTGTIDAPSLADARRRLRATGMHLVRIIEKHTQTHSMHAGTESNRAGTVRTRDVQGATRQLSILLMAGIPLVEALSTLIEQLGNCALSRILAQVRDRVNEGTSLADALADYPRVFPQVFVSMARAGESTGTLEQVLSRLADMFEKRAKLTNKVRSALTYPLIMAVVGCSVIIFILSYVLPSITKLFTEMNMTLPWMTVFLVKVSALTGNYLWLLTLSVLGLGMGHRYWIQTAGGRRSWDRIKLRCPLVGPILVSVAIARFARTLGVLLSSGITIVDALQLSRSVAGNTLFTEVIQETQEAVSQGQSVSQALAKDKLFPPVALHMIAAGEQSGGMEEGLLRIADSLDNEIETKLGALTSLLEPLMIMVLGGIVGFIVLAILLPIFDINSALV